MNIFDRLVSCIGGGLEARLPPRTSLQKQGEIDECSVSIWAPPPDYSSSQRENLSFFFSLSSGMLVWDHLTIAEPYSFWNLPWFSIISYCFLDIFFSRFYWLWPWECLHWRELPKRGPMRHLNQDRPSLELGPNCPFICLRLLKLRGGNYDDKKNMITNFRGPKNYIKRTKVLGWRTYERGDFCWLYGVCVRVPIMTLFLQEDFLLLMMMFLSFCQFYDFFEVYCSFL